MKPLSSIHRLSSIAALALALFACSDSPSPNVVEVTDREGNIVINNDDLADMIEVTGYRLDSDAGRVRALVRVRSLVDETFNVYWSVDWLDPEMAVIDSTPRHLMTFQGLDRQQAQATARRGDAVEARFRFFMSQ